MVKGKQSGQILLVVVLTMIVALTVGLSIAARVVTELRLSRQNEESQRAFQAAEAGIQQTLESKTPIGIPVSLENNASFSTTFLDDTGTVVVVNNGLEVDQAVGADVWLSDYSPTLAGLFANPMGGGAAVPVTMYWGDPNQTSCTSSGDGVAPAIEVVLLKGPLSNPTIQKNIYEAAGCAAFNRITNSIEGTTGVYTWEGVQFRNSAPLTFGGSNLSEGLIMKVIPIYNSTVVGFVSNDPDGAGPANPFNFPSQGSVVESTGTAGETVRKVVYFQSHPQLPLEIFPYSLISQ
jgi:hypothetical protein